MKLQFISNLAYQDSAVNSIVNIFKGQSTKQSNFTVHSGELFGVLQTELGIGNRLDLTSEEVLKNVQQVQMNNNLPKSEKLEGMNFTVEMETGTGKTYVYLKSIYELNKNYGFTKFVIVVPSVAIREGVNKSLQITKEHFQSIFDNVPFNYFVYDSSKLGEVRNFATSNTIQVMIINIDAFRKSFVDPSKEDKANVIHRANDKMQGYRPIEFISQTNPIVIIDEPQSVDTTDKSKEAIASLKPLCTLRYSATHVDKYNMVYRLDAVDAYENKLVKRIEVVSVKAEESFNKPYVKLLEVAPRKAKVEIDITDKGKPKKVAKWVVLGNDLKELSKGRDVYEGYLVDDISWGEGQEYIELNGNLLYLGDVLGEISEDELRRHQIRKTIEQHLDKEIRLNHKGIKVLSLFFIDKVANYREYDSKGNPLKGKYALIFEEEYSKLINKPKYKTLFNDIDTLTEVEKVHDGYFAEDKKGRVKDTKGNTAADDDVYNKIMKNKEQLLSLNEPLRFIFSHSALREGWDNPNVFQICTLKGSAGTYIKRRQEIGRGLRLAVEQSGKRVEDYNVNVLTVMANESYEDFVRNLQTEIEEDTGVKFGVVEKHMFASLAYGDAEGNVVSLGYENSEKLYNFLKENKYVSDKGKIEQKLKTDLDNNAFALPYEFSNWQAPIAQELKRRIDRLKIKDGSKKKKVEINKGIIEGAGFIELWDRIKYKTTYSIDFDSNKLIENCVEKIKAMPMIHYPRWYTSKYGITIHKEAGVEASILGESFGDEVRDEITLPDIITELQNKINLTRKTIIDILVRSKRLDDFKRNPQKFIDAVWDIIKREIRLFIVDGIKYHKIEGEDFYTIEQFNNEELLAYLKENAAPSTKSPFNYVLYDSDIEYEFAKRFESDENVKVYVKLPNWFKIDTPLGSYNPDWAVLLEKDGEEKLYFVVETKGTNVLELLKPEEQAKIKCAKEHFKALGTDMEFRAPENDPSKFILSATS